jgi:hypothetical protein
MVLAASSASARIWSTVTAQQRAQQREPRLDRQAAIRQARGGASPFSGPGSALGHPGPSFGVGRVPGQGGNHRRHDGDRWVVFQGAVVFEPPQPPLGRRGPPRW